MQNIFYRHEFEGRALPRVQEVREGDICSDPRGVGGAIRTSFLQATGGPGKSTHCLQRKTLLWHDD